MRTIFSGCGAGLILATAVWVTPAPAEPGLAYDVAALDDRAVAAADRRESCSACAPAYDREPAHRRASLIAIPPQAGARPLRLDAGAVADRPNARRQSERAGVAPQSSWRNARVETDPQEPVSFTVGMRVVNEQDVAADTLAKSDLVRFPSRQMMAGFRVDLGPSGAR